MPFNINEALAQEHLLLALLLHIRSFISLINEALQTFKQHRPVRVHSFFAQLIDVTYKPRGFATITASSPSLGGLKAMPSVPSHVSVPTMSPWRLRMVSIHWT